MAYHGIGIGRASSLPLFFNEALLDQLVEGISQLPVLSVPEGRIAARRLQSTLVAQFNQGPFQHGGVSFLHLAQEVDLEFEGRWTEVLEQGEVYRRHFEPLFLFVPMDEYGYALFCGCNPQSRLFFSRKLSPFMLTVVAWCRSRSNRAVARMGSGKISPQWA